MANEEISKLIRDFNNDENVIKLKNYYNSLSFMDILGVARNENAHSSFLAWLFDSNRNFGLGIIPLKLLLELLVYTDSDNVKNIDKNKILARSIEIIQTDEVEREYFIQKDKHGRIDVYIPFEVDNQKYAIVLENKVKAEENEIDGVKQTNKYFNHFDEISKSNKTKYIYVFLAPGNIKAANPNFINISYAMIVNDIINPLLLNDNMDKKVRWVLEDYLRILNKPNINDTNNSEIVLAVTQFEKGIISQIQNNHIDLHEYLKKAKSADEDSSIYNFLRYNTAVLYSIWPDLQIIKQSNNTFSKLGIKVNSILYLTKTENKVDPTDITVYTADEKNLVMRDDWDEPISITAAARKLVNREYNNYNGFNWFIYDGKILSSMRDENNK